MVWRVEAGRREILLRLPLRSFTVFELRFTGGGSGRGAANSTTDGTDFPDGGIGVESDGSGGGAGLLADAVVSGFFVRRSLFKNAAFKLMANF